MGLTFQAVMPSCAAILVPPRQTPTPSPRAPRLPAPSPLHGGCGHFHATRMPTPRRATVTRGNHMACAMRIGWRLPEPRSRHRPHAPLPPPPCILKNQNCKMESGSDIVIYTINLDLIGTCDDIFIQTFTCSCNNIR